MDSSLLTLPTTLGGWASIVALPVLIVNILLYYKQRGDIAIKDANIKDLLDRVNILERFKNDSEKQIAKLTTENEAFTKIISGTDPATKEYRTKVENALSKAGETHDVVIKMMGVVETMAKSSVSPVVTTPQVV